MFKHGFKIVIFFALLLIIALQTQAKATIVNWSADQRTGAIASTPLLVPENYSSIQEAIDAANPGDTVYVKNGTYYETIYINKTLTLVGTDPATTIVDASKSNATFNPVVSIYSEDAGNLVLRNLTVTGSDNAWGIYVLAASNLTIENSIVTNNHGGVLLDASYGNTLINNTIADNIYEGLLLFQSSGNIMKNNTISRNLYNFGILDSGFDNDIDESNSINEKPVYYIVNQTGLTINTTTYPEIGYLALINCSDVTVENLKLTNNYNGLLLAQTNSTHLTNNTFKGNIVGISIYSSANSTLDSNSIGDNWRGITLTDSAFNTFKHNNLTTNEQHIMITGNQLAHFLQDMDTTNTVDTKLVRYLTNQTDLIVNPYTFPNTGYLALVNCRNITAQALSMQNNHLLVAFSQNSTITQSTLTKGGISLQCSSHIDLLHNNLTQGSTAITVSHSDNNTAAMNSITQCWDHGILLESSAGNILVGNSVAECNIGIDLSISTNTSIIGNNVRGNKDYGVILTNSQYNAIYHNNFINNSMPGWQAVDSGIPYSWDNTWDNGYPSGGNYWSDYTGIDLHSGSRQTDNGPDAIGDAPYHINFLQRDQYPLMAEYHDFTVVSGQSHNIEIISNSSIANVTMAVWLYSSTPHLQPGQQYLLFFVTGETNTTGFCRVTVPRVLINGTYTVFVDWNLVPVTVLAESNSTHAYLYFTYSHSQHEVAIMPEYTGALLITSMIAITTIATVAHTKCRRFKERTNTD